MSKKYDSHRLPGDLEELSDYSNQELRLSREYAQVEEAYRKIQSFKKAVDMLESSETSYHQSAKAVGTAWPEAYEAFFNIDKALEDIPEKFNAELVMNSGFEDFKEDKGEVTTRYMELENAIEDAKDAYKEASAKLASEMHSSMMLRGETPLKYARKVNETKVFEERAKKLDNWFVTPEGSLADNVIKMLE